jgi:hypothetical protein
VEFYCNSVSRRIMHYLAKGYGGGRIGVQKAVREPTTVTGLSAKDPLMTSTL